MLQVFNFDEDTTIRTGVIDGDIYFVVKDLAEALDYAKTQNALELCRNFSNAPNSQLNKISDLPPATKWIPESDLYRLIMKSTKKEAEKFQDWVVQEVLPSIRKTGHYQVNTKFDALSYSHHTEIDLDYLKNKISAVAEVGVLLTKYTQTKITLNNISSAVNKTTGIDLIDLFGFETNQKSIDDYDGNVIDVSTEDDVVSYESKLDAVKVLIKSAPTWMKPTDISKQLNLYFDYINYPVSKNWIAKDINKLLAGAGYQKVTDDPVDKNKKWVLKSKGLPYAKLENKSGSNPNGSRYNYDYILWNKSILPIVFRLAEKEEKLSEDDI